MTPEEAACRSGGSTGATSWSRLRPSGSGRGRDGVYDVTVTVGDTIVATFVGRSNEIGGTLW